MKSIQDLFKIGRGPSSSHTIGPERAAKLFRERFPDADRCVVTLYGSLSKTGKGHGTDRVLMETLAPLPAELIFSEEDYGSYTHPNTMDFQGFRGEEVLHRMRVLSVGGGDIEVEGLPEAEPPEVYPENSFAEIVDFCNLRGLELWEYVEVNEGREVWDFLRAIWAAMNRSIDEGLAGEGILPGGLRVGRKAKHLYNLVVPGERPQVRECRIVSAYAFAVSEQNADCGQIVTAPTCGACGVLPAALRYIYETRDGICEDDILHALAVAGLIGSLIKRNASISGAECGCQAEIGSACAMTAAALCVTCGLSTRQIQYAAEIALEHHLGLTCDPICGLVQIPCIERNAVAAMRALNALNLSFFLSDTQRISFDMVVKTMYDTGIHLAGQYRETSEGGLAKLYERKAR